MPRLLYHFPLSLYCEKTRWNLDAKGLDYRGIELLPGPHAFTAWRLARIRTLPVLRDGQQAVGDSTAIALYLEDRYRDSPLLPADPALRTRALALEDRFDEVGDHVRRCVWSLAVDDPAVDRIFFREYRPGQRWLGALARQLLRQMIRRTFSVWPDRVEQSWAIVHAALAEIEETLQGDPARYLVGDHFTLADLTAATMLAPLLGPEESPWGDAHVPATGIALRQELRATVAGQWMTRVYREHRRPSRR